MFPFKDPIVDTFDRIRRFGLEYVFDRWYSHYKGTVVSNIDSQQQGRIKVSVPDLGYVKTLGTQTVVEPLEPFAYPCSPYAGENHGFYFPPEIGDNVWVNFDHGDKNVPNYLGSFWKNPAPTTKTLATTHVPQEFVSETSVPTKRGIKTRYGHALMFNDNPLSPSVTLWSGKQPTTPGPLTAERKQVLFLSDEPVSAGSYLFSNYGHVLALDDVNKQITLHGSGPGATNGLTITDPTNTIQLGTKTGHTFTILPTSISIKSATNQSLVLDETTSSINLTTLGSVNTLANTATITTTGATSITASGLASVIGNGIVVTSTGGSPTINYASGITTSTYVGAVSETFIGACVQTIGGVLTQTIAGVWSVIAGSVDISSVSIGLGSGTRYRLVDERFITLFNTHVHEVTGIGAPCLPPLIPITPGLANTLHLSSS